MAKSLSFDKIADNSCGLFTWRPNWLQKFVSYKYFIAVYLLIYMHILCEFHMHERYMTYASHEIASQTATAAKLMFLVSKQ